MKSGKKFPKNSRKISEKIYFFLKKIHPQKKIEFLFSQREIVKLM